MNEGRPNIVDLVKTGKVDMIINTPLGRESFYDEKSIRRAAMRYNVPCITTLSAANAAARGIRALVEQNPGGFAAADAAFQESCRAARSRRRRLSASPHTNLTVCAPLLTGILLRAAIAKSAQRRVAVLPESEPIPRHPIAVVIFKGRLAARLKKDGSPDGV